ncbi:MAG: OmpA family protein, partial [Candidatus Rokubacteria bacterium]|nr:OmpA family protein [Candidatus Rokubacteria bacterium]
MRDVVGKKEVEIGQRIDDVNGRVRQETQRVDVIETSVSDGAQRVAGMSAAMQTLQSSVIQASTRADGIDGRLTRLWTNRHNPKVVETIEIHFAFDRADLGDEAQTALRSLLDELRTNPGLTVELMGYTDPTGTREYNVQLSQRRV